MTPIGTLYPDLGKKATRVLLILLSFVAAAFFGYYLYASLAGTEYPGIHSNLRYLVTALVHVIACLALAQAVNRDLLTGRDILLSWLTAAGIIYILILALGTWNVYYGGCIKKAIYSIPSWLCWLPYGSPVDYFGADSFFISPFRQSLYVIGPAMLGHAGPILTGIICFVRRACKKNHQLS